MNYLAHAWLARHADEAILGALLGDFVFGQAALLDWPDVVRGEIVAQGGRFGLRIVEMAGGTVPAGDAA